MGTETHGGDNRTQAGTLSLVSRLLGGSNVRRGERVDLSTILIGRRLANREGETRKITALEGVPAMGLDGLASSAYGPEAALTILMAAGAAGF